MCLDLSEQKQMTSLIDRVSPGFTFLGSIGPVDNRMTVLQYFVNIEFSLSSTRHLLLFIINLLNQKLIPPESLVDPKI